LIYSRCRGGGEHGVGVVLVRKGGCETDFGRWSYSCMGETTVGTISALSASEVCTVGFVSGGGWTRFFTGNDWAWEWVCFCSGQVVDARGRWSWIGSGLFHVGELEVPKAGRV
jgi:hypothetical protein